jgi:hypothetical protein
MVLVVLNHLVHISQLHAVYLINFIIKSIGCKCLNQE